MTGMVGNFLYNAFYTIKVNILINKRPMGHIAHLRKQVKSINTYDYIIKLIKRRKSPLLTLWELNGSSFEQTWILFTQRCFVPSLLEICPVEKRKSLFTDRQTADNRRSEKHTRALSSGEIKITVVWHFDFSMLSVNGREAWFNAISFLHDDKIKTHLPFVCKVKVQSAVKNT